MMATLSERQRAEKYIRAIRSETKRGYAQAFWDHIACPSALYVEPKQGEMATETAKRVRLRLCNIIGRNGGAAQL